MKSKIMHPWELNEEEAVSIQRELAQKVIQQDQYHDITYVAGVDVAYSKQSDVLIAAVVILEAASLKLVESVTVEDRVQFPYIPGLFSFRELPPVIKAFKQIKTPPDLVVCDGQGIAHPRRFGLASHLGVLLDIPTIGCGKTRLLGTYDEPGDSRGSHSPLIDNDEVVGHVLRTQDHVKPIFVSIGHKISLNTASAWILKLSPQYRLPETTRQADHLVKMALNKLNPS
ncbi:MULTISPECIES: deoxyribonuclease V [Paenibacillus]|uniref:deoxyribonuclease V n=1 Tax=Paenibacillus TaxID=44249 RepID=UPI002FE00821